MPNLWTDHDDGAHPWIAGRAPAAAPPPAPAPAAPTDERATAGPARALAFAAACVGAAVVGFVLEVLR